MASRHSLEQLDAAMNTCDVLEGDQDQKSVHFHLDEKSMGIGGDNSWLPNVLDQYLVSAEDTEMMLVLAPVLNENDLWKTLSAA